MRSEKFCRHEQKEKVQRWCKNNLFKSFQQNKGKLHVPSAIQVCQNIDIFRIVQGVLFGVCHIDGRPFALSALTFLCSGPPC